MSASRLPPQRLPASVRNERAAAAQRTWSDAQSTFAPPPDREPQTESRAMKEELHAWRGMLRSSEVLPARRKPRQARPRRRAPTVPAAPAFRTAARAARARAKPKPEPPKPKPRGRPTSRPRLRKPAEATTTEKPWWARARDICVDVSPAPPPPPLPEETPEHHFDAAMSVVAAAKAEVKRRDAARAGQAERDLDNAAEARRVDAAATRGGAPRGRAKKPATAPPVAADPWVVSAAKTSYADARRAAAVARADNEFLDRRPGESPSEAARRFVHDASTSPPRARPGQTRYTTPDAPPLAYGVDAETATPSYMKPTHKSGYRYKIDPHDGDWYRSDDPRMRPLDPQERVAVAAAGDAYAAACRARAHYHEIEQYGTFARSVAMLTRRAAATLEQEARASEFRDAALCAHNAVGRATQAWRDAAKSFIPSPVVK